MRNTFSHRCDVTAKNFADFAKFRKEHVLATTLYFGEIIALLHFPCDFQAGKKVSFPQKKRIRVR